VSDRPSAADRLHVQEALLTRSDLRELGLDRRAVDAVFRSCPVIALPGYARPLVRVSDYLALLERSTYDDSALLRQIPRAVGPPPPVKPLSLVARCGRVLIAR
jgi:hypothetical protein